jgi:hypothetical protein
MKPVVRRLPESSAWCNIKSGTPVGHPKEVVIVSLGGIDMAMQSDTGFISWTFLMATEDLPRIRWDEDKRVLRIQERLEQAGQLGPFIMATASGRSSHTWVNPNLAAELLVEARPSAFSEVRVVQHCALTRLAVQFPNCQCATLFSHSLHSSTMLLHVQARQLFNSWQAPSAASLTGRQLWRAG